MVNMPMGLVLCLVKSNNTGMQLNEFKDLLRKVMNTPGMLEDIATGGIIPTGGIIMWSGTTVPTGWYLCDGTNGTPNLTGKFIYGGALGDNTTAAQQDTVIADHSNHSDHVFTQPTAHPATYVGGSTATLSLNNGTGVADTAADDTHLHQLPSLSHSGGAVDAHTAHSAHSVTTQYFPPYYTLAYIMKS